MRNGIVVDLERGLSDNAKIMASPSKPPIKIRMRIPRNRYDRTRCEHYLGGDDVVGNKAIKSFVTAKATTEASSQDANTVTTARCCSFVEQWTRIARR